MVWTVGEHDEKVFVILTRQHRVTPAHAPWKQRHPFVLHRSAVQRKHAKVKEVLRLNELRQNGPPIVSRVGGVVHHRAVVINETHKAGILYTVRLIRRDRKDDALAQGQLGGEIQLVVGICQPAKAFKRTT